MFIIFAFLSTFNAFAVELHDYVGAIHVHSKYSFDSHGEPAHIADSAKAAHLSFVMMSDHPNPNIAFDASSPSVTDFDGMHDGVLFFPGVETKQGFLALGVRHRMPDTDHAQDVIPEIDRDKGLAVASHIEDRDDAFFATTGWTVMEIYNLHYDALLDHHIESLFGPYLEREALPLLKRGMIGQAIQAAVGALSYEALLHMFFERSDRYIERWDQQLAQGKKVVGIGANDCHENFSFRTQAFHVGGIPVKGDLFGRHYNIRVTPSFDLPSVQVPAQPYDTYERCFKQVRTHVFAEALTQEAILKAIRLGHVYVGHGSFRDESGFKFTAVASQVSASPVVSSTDAGGSTDQDASVTTDRDAGPADGATPPPSAVARVDYFMMGDEFDFKQYESIKLHITLPSEAKLDLYKDGKIIQSLSTTLFEFNVTQPGVYRVEASIRDSEKTFPWIYSNPIYIR